MTANNKEILENKKPECITHQLCLVQNLKYNKIYLY